MPSFSFFRIFVVSADAGGIVYQDSSSVLQNINTAYTRHAILNILELVT